MSVDSDGEGASGDSERMKLLLVLVTVEVAHAGFCLPNACKRFSSLGSPTCAIDSAVRFRNPASQSPGMHRFGRSRFRRIAQIGRACKQEESNSKPGQVIPATSLPEH
eukprot:753239-Hanusia_phi.AAC.3